MIPSFRGAKVLIEDGNSIIKEFPNLTLNSPDGNKTG